mgnify:CR=1 FL=1
MNELEKAARLLKNAQRILILTGAGMSTESGLKDFRSKDGLAQKTYEGYYPEEILSREFFYAHTGLFYQYLKENLNVSGYSPNKGHRLLAAWEQTLPLQIITQNIDGFHQEAGSKRVLEIHGTLATTTCTHCIAQKPLKQVLKEGPTCLCGGLFKPDIVLYDEEVKGIQEAFIKAREADLLLVLGTSLKVYPAASIPEVFDLKNNPAIIINKEETAYAHHYKVLEIHQGIGSSLEKINGLFKKLQEGSSDWTMDKG